MSLPENLLRALHRKPALVLPNDSTTRPKVPHSQPVQQPPALARKDEGETPRAGRPCVRFKLCRVRLLDVDAKYTSLKDVLDGLVIAGLAPGDREEEISLECVQEKVGTYAEERTEIEIEYPTA